MKTFYTLRSPEGDGSAGGGGDTSTPTTDTSTTAPQQVASLWGNSGTPDWVKAAGLEKVHQKSGGDGSPAQQTTPAQTAPAQTQQTVAQTQQVAPAVQTPATQVPATQTSAAVVTPPAPAPMTLTADVLAEAMSRVMGTQTARAEAGAPPLTDEQIAQQLGVFNATVTDYEEAFGVKPTAQQLTTYNKHLQNIARQAVTIGQTVFQNRLSQLEQTYSPMVQAVRQQAAAQQLNTFYTENPDLKGFEAFVEQTYEVLKARGTRFSSPEAARKAIADQARSTLKSAGITPGATPSTASTTQTRTSPQTASRKMPTTSVGGRGGGSAEPAAKLNTMQAVWGS